MPDRKGDTYVAPVHFEDDDSDENSAKCPGFYEIEYSRGGNTYNAIVRCEEIHPRPPNQLSWSPHREQVRVEGHHRNRVPLYPWAGRLLTKQEFLFRKQRNEGKPFQEPATLATPAPAELTSIRAMVEKLKRDSARKLKLVPPERPIDSI